MGIKGQKINPVGWRLGFYRKWKSNWFQESWNYGLMLNKTLKIENIIKSFLLYKRFPSLTCNIMLLNNGNSKFTIFVFFYNLRSEETNFLKKERKKLGKNSKFKTLYKLWDLEKTQQKLKNNKKKIQAQSFFLSTNFVKNRLNFLKKETLVKPVKMQYITLFNKQTIKTNKKVNILDTLLSTSAKVFYDQFFFLNLLKYINFSKFFFKSNFKYLEKLAVKKSSFNIFVLDYNKLKLNLAYWLLYKNSFNFLNLNKQLKLTIYNFFNHFIFYLNSCFFNIKKYEFMQFKNFKSINLKFFIKKKKLKTVEHVKKNFLWFIKSKTSQKNGKYNPILKFLQTKQKKEKIDRTNYKKLVDIKMLALIRKFKRLNFKQKQIIWKIYFNPVIRSMNFYNNFPKQVNLNKYLNIYFQNINLYLYLKSKGKLFNLNKKKKNTDLFFLSDFQQDLKSKSSLVNNHWFFSLNDLRLSLSSILQQNIEIYFINTLSLLRYQSKFIWLNSYKSVRKLGFNLLWQQLRFNKINANRQKLSLIRQPFLLERRNKRFGPFIQDFVLLVLIALITRNFKVLLKFINYQTQFLSKSKRQIPFIRLLIRLIANLGGSLVKIKGLRIQFKGRFDRWNRTKSIIYTSGNIPFQRKDIDIEYSSSHGQVQKGIFGIRLWVWYGKNYHLRYKELFKSYWYSNYK